MVKRRGGAELTGLGGNAPVIMDGQSTGNEDRDKLVNKCAKDCYEVFFKGTKKDYGVVDAGEDSRGISFGIEPSYFGDPLKIIRICRKKKWSNFETGIAKGYYGRGIRSTKKYYFEYSNSSKFTRFIDRWHPILFKEGEESGILKR